MIVAAQGDALVQRCLTPAVDAIKDWLRESATFEEDGTPLLLTLLPHAQPHEPCVSLALESAGSSSGQRTDPPIASAHNHCCSTTETKINLTLTHADFSRHRVGSLAFESATGALEPPKPDVLARLLAGGLSRSGQLDGGGVVFLNACDTAVQARWLLQQGAAHVIYCPRRISDGAAAEFSRGFYDSLASHRNVAEAYEQVREGECVRVGVCV